VMTWWTNFYLHTHTQKKRDQIVSSPATPINLGSL
jgi:hypothetical protein